MEAVASMVESFNEFGKSSQKFLSSLSFPDFHGNRRRRNPIEILKRLQREAFFDLSKLRDRQDKVERILSLHRLSQGNSNTRVRGEVDVLGALLFNADGTRRDVAQNAGINPGVLLRFIFSTMIREADNLQAELVSSSDVPESPLSLAKVLYRAKVTSWLSATVVPIGAQFKDFADGFGTASDSQERGFSDLSSPFPPFLNSHMGTAVGFTARNANISASLCQSVSRNYADVQSFGTFGQIACMIRSTVITGFGWHQTATVPNYLLLPVTILKTEGSRAAMKVETPLDANTKISVWVEVKTQSTKSMVWAVNVIDNAEEDENGWGFNVGGCIEGDWRRRLQSEAFLKLNFGPKFCLKPGVVCAMENDDSKILSFIVKSNWSF